MSGLEWSDKKREPAKRAKALFADVRAIEQEQSYRDEEWLRYLRLYSEREWQAFSRHRRGGGGGGSRKIGMSDGGGSRSKVQLGLNVVRNNVNAATNMTGRNRPMPTVTAMGTNYDRRRRCRDMQRFLVGAFSDVGIWQVGQDYVLKGGNIFGTAGIEIYRRRDSEGNARIAMEPIYPSDIRVRDSEHENGYPYTLRRVLMADVERLKAAYPKLKREIDKAASTGEDGERKRLEVVKAWDAPSQEGGDDGAYIVAIDGVELEFSPWRRMRTPHAWYRWETEPYKFLGTGIPEELSSIQYEINSVILTVQSNVRNGGHLRVFVQRGSNVPPGHLMPDRRGSVVYHDGMEPHYSVTDVFSPQVLQYLQWLKSEASQLIGMSELWAQSQDPGGSMSGKARAIHHQTHSLRFVNNVRRYEQMFIDASQAVIAEAEEERESGRDMRVLYAGHGQGEALSWSDIRIPSDLYDLQIHSAAFLSQMPSARIEEANWLYEKKWMTQNAAREAMGIPFDLWHEEEMDTAPRHLIEMRIGRMLDHGEPFQPTSEMDLEMALELSSKTVQQAELLEVDPERIDMVRAFRDEVLLMMEENAPAPAPPPMPMGPPMGPPGAGMVPPMPGPVQ